MQDFVTLDPNDFTEEQLMTAARGLDVDLQPALAVSLLRVKLGEQAEQPLRDLAASQEVDSRARHAAVLALAAFPGVRDLLTTLSASKDSLVASAARQALASM